MAQKWNTQVVFPQDNYLIRCIKAEFGPSKSSGKPMITLGFEIVSPENINVAGSEYIVAGQNVSPLYIVTKSIDADGNVDVSKSETIKKMVDDLCAKFKVAEITDPENPDVTVFVGKTVWALLNGEKRERRKAPTSEQLAAGQKQGDVIKNPITGEPLVSYYPKIDQIFGVPNN